MTTTTTEPASVAFTGCCRPVDPSIWDRKQIVWHDHAFVVENVHSLLHVPLDMGRKMKHAMRLIEAAGAEPDPAIMLVDEISPFRSTLYIDVTRDVPGARMTTLSGTFLTKVYDGPFRDVPKWADDMRGYVKEQGRELDKLYFSYTTCPRCAKAYGHNYVVLFARVREATH